MLETINITEEQLCTYQSVLFGANDLDSNHKLNDFPICHLSTRSMAGNQLFLIYNKSF